MKNILKINEFLENFYSDELEMKKLYKAVFNLMGYTNQKLVKMLGKNSGGSGDPFRMDDGKVLKITTDKLEAYNAELLISNKSDAFAIYHKAAFVDFKNPEDKKVRKNTYALLMDFINVVDRNSEDIKLYVFLKDNFFHSIDKEGNEVLDFCNFNNVNDYLEKFKEMNSEDKLIPICEEHNIDMGKCKKIYDRLMYIMEQAITHKLYLMDVNIENLAINNNGDIIVFDLGGGMLGVKISKTLPEIQNIITIDDLNSVELSQEDIDLKVNESLVKYNNFK